MNWLAVLSAAVAYWILGAIWYSVLFGKTWAAALEQFGIKCQPGGMAPKLIGTFIGNLVAAVVMERLIQRAGIVGVVHGLRLGLAVGAGFSATALTITYLWQQQPTKVWLIDVFYYILGAALVGAILTAWP
jgi:hypothetical protein